MKINIEELHRCQPLATVIIRSLDLSLYHAVAVIDGREHLISDGAGKPLRYHSIMGFKRRLAGFNIKQMLLQQHSAFDEMIGQPPKQQANTLQVPMTPLCDPFEN
jgi:hypothetical protein